MAPALVQDKIYTEEKDERKTLKIQQTRGIMKTEKYLFLKFIFSRCVRSCNL